MGAGAVAVLLIPWCVFVVCTLPRTMNVVHWPLLWLGLDTAEAVSASVTLLLLLRRSPAAALSAAVGAGLFFADALFDVGTSMSSGGLPVSILMAVCGEIPTGVAALWFAVRALRQHTVPTGRQPHQRMPIGGTSNLAPSGEVADEVPLVGECENPGRDRPRIPQRTGGSRRSMPPRPPLPLAAPQCQHSAPAAAPHRGNANQFHWIGVA